MFKFKNKLKFGTSTEKQHHSSDSQNDSTGANSSTYEDHNDTTESSIRESNNSRKTVSIDNLTDEVNKLSVDNSNGRPNSSQHSRKSSERSTKQEINSHHQQNNGNTNNILQPPSTDSNITSNSSQYNNSPASSQATSLGQASSVSGIEDVSNSTSNSSSPGLLTVKIYGSQNIQLPIKINNNKQILHALAINSNNENIGQQLLKNLENVAKENDAEYLPGALATKLLPSIITIPNAENLVKSLLYLTIEFDNNVLVIEPQKGTVYQSTWNQVVSFDVTNKSSNSNIESQFLNLNLFIRLPNMLIPDSEKLRNNQLFTNYQQDSANPNRSMSSNSSNTSASPVNIGDLLIGTIKLPLNPKSHTQQVRLMHHEYLNFTNYNVNGNNKDSHSKEMGEIMLTIEFKPLSKKHLSIEDFDLLKVIGKGSFGKVMQVVKKDTKQIYALKTLRKQHIVSRMEVTHTLAERTVLARINNPFIVPLKFSFQSPEKLYLVLSFINGGELFWHLQREGKFSMDRSRFYIAELLTALESLHDLNVIYRDLKPENILLDYQGHIALCDFGLCKLNMSNEDKTNTFCGTPEYLAPELLLNQGYTRSVDWWTLGTLLYEMLTGLPPFYDSDSSTMYKKILQNPLRFPPFLEGTDAQDLLIKLLQKDPSQRLDDAQEIKNHSFFKDIDWNKLLNKSYLPPFKPNVENLLDTSNFDQDFTNEKPQDSVVDDFLTESVQKQFGGWTYNGDNML
ncbi:YPK2 [Candida pseudojiufengensis]|uniref:YPK2 n=1 Tax=Candida pseudojiufengensis TaxID=497109 RepID=UPI002224EB43|nr:YPK2 [Candida pseudojiufengensis]KAI5964838.1 YPK2 [Candida pseudojiufengensis]